MSVCLVRQAPGAMPKAIRAGLAKQGIKVSNSLVNAVKYGKSKPGKSKPGKRGRKPGPKRDCGTVSRVGI